MRHCCINSVGRIVATARLDQAALCGLFLLRRSYPYCTAQTFYCESIQKGTELLINASGIADAFVDPHSTRACLEKCFREAAIGGGAYTDHNEGGMDQFKRAYVGRSYLDLLASRESDPTAIRVSNDPNNCLTVCNCL
jgi:hypothetical protein